MQPVLTVMISETLVDWLKHAFITKFNHIRPSVYETYTDVLCRDLASASAFGRYGRKVSSSSYSLYGSQSFSTHMLINLLSLHDDWVLPLFHLQLWLSSLDPNPSVSYSLLSRPNHQLYQMNSSCIISNGALWQCYFGSGKNFVSYSC